MRGALSRRRSSRRRRYRRPNRWPIRRRSSARRTLRAFRDTSSRPLRPSCATRRAGCPSRRTARLPFRSASSPWQRDVVAVLLLEIAPDRIRLLVLGIGRAVPRGGERGLLRRILALGREREPCEPAWTIRRDAGALEVREAEVVLRVLHRPACGCLPRIDRGGVLAFPVRLETLLEERNAGEIGRDLLLELDRLGRVEKHDLRDDRRGRSGKQRRQRNRNPDRRSGESSGTHRSLRRGAGADYPRRSLRRYRDAPRRCVRTRKRTVTAPADRQVCLRRRVPAVRYRRGRPAAGRNCGRRVPASGS